MEIHIPPKYDQYGNRQFWFLEFEASDADEMINGFLHAALLFVPLLALWIFV